MSVCADHIVRLWSAKKESALKSLSFDGQPIRALEWIEEIQALIVIEEKGILRTVWKIAKGKEPEITIFHADGTVMNSKVLGSLKVHNGPVLEEKANSEPQKRLSASTQIWGSKIKGNDEITQLSHKEIELDPHLEQEVHREVLDEVPNSNYSYVIAVTTETNPSLVNLYDVENGKLVSQIDSGHVGIVNCLTALNGALLTGGQDKKIRLFE